MPMRIRQSSWGLLLLALAAAAGTALAIYSYFLDLGINHTDGVLVVIGSTVIMWIAALVLAWARGMWWWPRGIIVVLLLLDVVGTGVAGYFLEKQVLMAFMGVAFLGWLAHVVLGPGRVPDVKGRLVA
jgi:hypothetical protein